MDSIFKDFLSIPRKKNETLLNYYKVHVAYIKKGRMPMCLCIWHSILVHLSDSKLLYENYFICDTIRSFVFTSEAEIYLRFLLVADLKTGNNVEKHKDRYLY